MIHNFAHVQTDNIFVISGVSQRHAPVVADRLTEFVLQGPSAKPELVRSFLLGEIGIRSLERANPYLTCAETRVMMQFRKLYHAMLTAWGKGAAKHPTRTFVYENFNTSQTMIVIFLGWTTEGDRRTADLFGSVEAGDWGKMTLSGLSASLSL